MIWVIDASVAVRWFIEDEAHANAEEILDRVVNAPETFAVPELFAFEVYSVLMRLHPEGSKTFKEGIMPLLNSGILRQPMTEDLVVKASRFVAFGLTGYDACYAALAEDLGGRWLTYDEKAHKLIKRRNVSCLLTHNMPDK